ncbi:MAG TPA: zf-HC2 domain-containing protein [Candidatus Goldiibacteriota bacterium]|nr:zf-HC2 domain-containing protein [Candidatus Goldiibacteriota bacterium]
MSCNFTKKLYDYLNNELDETNRKNVEFHLRICPVCTKELKTLQSIKNKFKKNLQNPSPALFYNVKKKTKTNNWFDYVLLHKKIFEFSATFAFIIAGMIFFNSTFYKNNGPIDEFLNDVYSFNTFENDIFETVSDLDIFKYE